MEVVDKDAGTFYLKFAEDGGCLGAFGGYHVLGRWLVPTNMASCVLVAQRTGCDTPKDLYDGSPCLFSVKFGGKRIGE